MSCKGDNDETQGNRQKGGRNNDREKMRRRSEGRDEYGFMCIKRGAF